MKLTRRAVDINEPSSKTREKNEGFYFISEGVNLTGWAAGKAV
jgi:hypothetical protein